MKTVKYVIVIADGAADLPLPQLRGQTPFEAARTPNLDALARAGILGTARTTPPRFDAGSDVCSMDLLGYDPRRYHTGRAPLEAAAIDMPIGPRDWVFRVNLVTVGTTPPTAAQMLDHSAGAIPDAEAKPLFDALLTHWRQHHPALAGALRLQHGVSYRASMVDSSGATYSDVRTTPPHEIPGLPWTDFLPAPANHAGDAPARALRSLIESSRQFLATHPTNAARVAAGKRPANLAWIWGQGTRPNMPPFAERFGLRGGMITAVDLLAGIARLIGWERLAVPGVTSYHDTDYAAQGRATVEALDRLDVVCCHLESPDEASHQADWQTKVAAIESIDERVIAPIARRAGEGDVRLIVLPDHYTLVSTRKHDATPVPFLIAGNLAGLSAPAPRADTPAPTRRFTEAAANASGWHLPEGHTLMDAFLARA